MCTCNQITYNQVVKENGKEYMKTFENKNHQLMHGKCIIFIPRKSATCFDPAMSPSGRTVSLH
jgi:hypothetical protein